VASQPFAQAKRRRPKHGAASVHVIEAAIDLETSGNPSGFRWSVAIAAECLAAIPEVDSIS
jgi:hypothetical protein